MALQSTVANKEVLDAMKQSRDAFSAHVSDKVVEEVAEIVDDIEDNLGLLNEMDEALSQPVTNILDDANLEEELEQLEELEIEMPEIPGKKKIREQQPSKEKEKDELDSELEQLEKSLFAL
jgi:hypothetical protein